MLASDPRMPGRRLRSLLPALCALLGAACEASLAPIEVGSGCPDQPLRGPDDWADEPRTRLIDDFEYGDLRLVQEGGRNGSWILGTDTSSGILVAESSSRCAARGAKAGHFRGAGFSQWGANWTAVFRSSVGGVAQPYDGRAYGGISFWAAAGQDARAPFSVPVGLTTVDVAWNGYVCSSCMDFYKTVVPLSRDWQRIEIRFDDLHQSGWGDQFPMRRDQLVGFIVWPNHQFDVWIDDVRFEP